MNHREIEKRLDKLVQTVQRCEGADENWTAICVTCGRRVNCFGKNCMQGGHFIPRGCKITRWVGENVHPQCTRCNGFLNGNYIMYSRWMQVHYPEDYLHLLSLFEQHKKGTAPHLTTIERIATYNSWLKKGRELEERSGMQLFPKSWDYVKM